MKLLHYYQRIESDSRLILVGSDQLGSYANWLREFANELRLEDSVVFAGHVTQAEMVAYYQVSDLFVSMSEHEGFGKPLIESMYFDLPVMAFASTGVPYTMGNVGILFRHKHFEALAELADILIKDEEIQQKVIEGQRRRIQDFLEPQVLSRWWQFLRELDLSV